MRLKRTAASNISLAAYPSSRAIGSQRVHRTRKQLKDDASESYSTWILSALLFTIGVGLYILSLFWPLFTLSMPWLAILIDILGITLILLSLRIIWKKPKITESRI